MTTSCDKYIVMHVLRHTYTHTHTYIHTYIHTHINTHIYIHTHTYITHITYTHTYIRTYTHTYMCCVLTYLFEGSLATATKNRVKHSLYHRNFQMELTLYIYFSNFVTIIQYFVGDRFSEVADGNRGKKGTRTIYFMKSIDLLFPFSWKIIP